MLLVLKNERTGSMQLDGATRCGVSQKSPNLHYLAVNFGIFLAIFGKPHLVARQNVTFWKVGKNMSDGKSNK